MVTFATPDEAEQAFYAAFEARSLKAMSEVWADDDGIVCVHPLGERLVGRRAVLGSWEQILANSPPMRFHRTDIRRSTEGTLAVHTLYENIIVGDDPQPRAPMPAINVYRLTGQGWRLVVHQASPIHQTARRGSATVH